MRVLHVLHNSLPLLCGYSIRSRYILENQRAAGLEVRAVTSAQHPNGAADEEVINGILYRRTRAGSWPHLPVVREARQMLALQRQVETAIEEFRPDLVHAHSPVLVGLPALRAAKRAKIPFVYEVRDLWENAAVDRGRFGHGSMQYRIARSLETRVLRRAGAVVTICEQLKRELSPRAGGGGRVTVVPNGVDAVAFTPAAPDAEVCLRYGLGDGPTILYAGTFQPYEGLVLLIQAFAAVKRAYPAAKLLIAGGSASRAYAGQERSGLEVELESMAAGLGVADSVIFTGRVPHETVRQLYGVADLVTYPRLLTRTTALTTPLKPLEAMAMGKAVLVSDVAAMGELVEHGRTGWSFEAGNADSLARACCALLADPAGRGRLGADARVWASGQRHWPIVIGAYLTLYSRLTGLRVRAEPTTLSNPAVA